MADLTDIQKKADPFGKIATKLSEDGARLGRVSARIAEQAERRHQMLLGALTPTLQVAELARQIQPVLDTTSLARELRSRGVGRISDMVAAACPPNLGLDLSKLHLPSLGKIGMPDFNLGVPDFNLGVPDFNVGVPDFGRVATPDLGLGLRTGLDRPALTLAPLSSTPTRRKSRRRRRPGRKKAAKPVAKAEQQPKGMCMAVTVAVSTAYTVVTPSKDERSRLSMLLGVVKSPHASAAIVSVTTILVVGHPFAWIVAGLATFCSLLFVCETMDMVRKGKRPSTALKKALRRYTGLGKRKR